MLSYFRLSAIIFLFTPSLGIFDTLYHGILGSLSVTDGNRTFDYSDNGSTITFEQAWNKFKLKDSSEFLSIPICMVLSILLIIFIFHAMASALLHKVASVNNGDKCGLSFSHMTQGLHSFLTPPLHLDWMEFFGKPKGNLPIRSCWKR